MAKVATKRLSIIGTIDHESYQKFSDELAEIESTDVKTKITIELNSPGGEGYCGLAFFDRIRLSLCKDITVYSFGQVMSAATLIPLAARYHIMSANCWYMLHDDTGSDSGGFTHDQAVEVAHRLKVETQWAEIIYAATLREDVSFWRKLSKDIAYLTAEECLYLDICQEIK